MIYLGADHGGFELKEQIKAYLDELGFDYKDLGNTEYEPKDDYPDYAFRVAEAVSKGGRGILLCRSAAGMVIAANKVEGIRAVGVTDVKSAVHSRKHNDSNIIALSGDWMDLPTAKNIVKAWLHTEFSGEERHVRRLKKIEGYR